MTWRGAVAAVLGADRMTRNVLAGSSVDTEDNTSAAEFEVAAGRKLFFHVDHESVARQPRRENWTEVYDRFGDIEDAACARLPSSLDLLTTR